MSVVCGQEEFFAKGRSFAERSPSECDVSECDRGASYWRARPTGVVEPWTIRSSSKVSNS